MKNLLKTIFDPSFILLLLFYVIFIVTVVLLCVMINHRDDTINTLENNIKELKINLDNDERKLTLEYSVGYWSMNKPEELNDSTLLSFLNESGAWYPSILMKQAKLESSNYHSRLYTKNNNLFGMKTVYIRKTTQSGLPNKKYGYYINWKLSVLDRILWDLNTFETKPTEREYLNTLQKYAEDPNYINKLKLK